MKGCPKKFDFRQHKDYPGVSKAEFLCTTSAPTCTGDEDDCAEHGAFPDHWSSDCDATEETCWTGDKIVCLKPIDCCEGYTLRLGMCEKSPANVTVV